MRPAILTVFILLALLSGALYLLRASRCSAGHLDVLCGAGLIKPMDQLCDAFKAREGVTVRVSYAGSGTLMGALAAGQPCDVFIPAATRYVEDAAQRGWVAPGSRRDLVYHVPVIGVPADNPAAITGLADLCRPGVRLALGDRDACAIGRVAEAIFAKNGLADGVAGNVRVRTATVNELIVYLAMGQADAAILWEDLLRWPEASGKLRAVPIPPEQNAIRTIAAARTSRADHPASADAFVQFLASDAAVAIWRQWGFDPCIE